MVLLWLTLFLSRQAVLAQAQDRLAGIQQRLENPATTDSMVVTLSTEALALAIDPVVRGDLLYQQAGARLALGDPNAARIALEAAATSLAPTEDSAARVRVFTRLGRVHQRLGTFAEGVGWLEQGLPLLPNVSPSEQAALLNVLGTLYAITGDNPTASRYFEDARTAYVAAGDRVGEANIVMNLGLVAEQVGEVEEAMTYMARADSLALLLDDAVLQLRIATNLGSALVDQGRYTEALATLARARRLADEVGDAFDLTLLAIKQGRALHGMGRFAEVIPMLNAAVQQARALGDPAFEGEAVQLLKDAYAQVGNFDAAYSWSLVYDSLSEVYFSETNQRILQELEAEQKATQIASLEQAQALDRAQLRQQRLLIGATLLIALLLGLLMVLYLRRSREQAAQAAQLHSLDQARSRFFANISHELRTPLTLILSPIEEALKTL